jgi:hypothetical protein
MVHNVNESVLSPVSNTYCHDHYLAGLVIHQLSVMLNVSDNV